MVTTIELDGKPVTFVDSPEDIATVVKALTPFNQVALDLEFDRNRYRYGFNMCLMQLATPNEVFLVDAVRIKNEALRPIYDIFEDPAIEKIIFAGQEDMKLLVKCGCQPKNLYDLKIAARLTLQPGESLRALAQNYLGLELEKGEQASNWWKRPLKPSQLAYAARDVLYLHGMREWLHPQLVASGRMHWFTTEITFLENEVPETREMESDNFMDHKDVKDLNYKQRILMRSFYNWRENLAEKYKLPAHYMCSREKMLEVVKAYFEEKTQELDARGMHPYFKDEKNWRNFLAHLATEYQEAKNAPKPEGKPHVPKAEKRFASLEEMKAHMIEYKERIKPLQELLAEWHGIDLSRLLISNRVIEKLAKKQGTMDDLPKYAAAEINKAAQQLGIAL